MADCHHILEEKWWIYLVRSLGFQPEPSSHDWHVQPSCQRTESLPPERALSVQCRNTQVRFCLSSKLVQTTRLARPLSTRCDHRISTCFPQPRSLTTLFQRSSKHATKRISHTAPMPFSAQAEAEDDQFEKRSLGGSCQQRLNPSRNLVPE